MMSRSAQLRQLRRCIDRWREAPGIDTIFVLGDLNSLDMGTAEVEAATGLHKLSSGTPTHATDGCIDHVLGSCALVDDVATAGGGGGGGGGLNGGGARMQHRKAVTGDSQRRQGRDRQWHATTDVVETASDHLMVMVDLVEQPAA